ncbi:MAG: LysR substrate-binding domain-containing protein [SAR324 cluster bacterium]|nr:LysR substrate-binding domain-containing protein [SAR324 cluster bacterium]
MPIEFRHHDLLRVFVEVAQHGSFSDAADALNLTKGAISYQIKTLETVLEMTLFRRDPRGVALTRNGQNLLMACRSYYQEIESEVLALKGIANQSLTVGMSSYFAARWLSPRLMSFMQMHQSIQLRIQPMIQLFDLEFQGVDIAIRWGNGNWDDVEITPFLPLPAFPTGNAEIFQRIQAVGMEQTIQHLTLLNDHDESNAWTDWLDIAGLPRQIRRDTLIIPDPNVRVQAVIDGQGIALMDSLIQRELDEKLLFRLSDQELSEYGYFIARPRPNESAESIEAFVEWLRQNE